MKKFCFLLAAMMCLSMNGCTFVLPTNSHATEEYPRMFVIESDTKQSSNENFKYNGETYTLYYGIWKWNKENRKLFGYVLDTQRPLSTDCPIYISNTGDTLYCDVSGYRWWIKDGFRLPDPYSVQFSEISFTTNSASPNWQPLFENTFLSELVEQNVKYSKQDIVTTDYFIRLYDKENEMYILSFLTLNSEGKYGLNLTSWDGKSIDILPVNEKVLLAIEG